MTVCISESTVLQCHKCSYNNKKPNKELREALTEIPHLGDLHDVHLMLQAARLEQTLECSELVM